MHINEERKPAKAAHDPASNSATAIEKKLGSLSPTLLHSIDEVVLRSLREDLGLPIEVSDQDQPFDTEAFLSRDITSSSIVPAHVEATGRFVVKAPGVIAGLPVVERLFNLIDPNCRFEAVVQEGDSIDTPPHTVAEVTGSARLLLLAERTALNLLQRTSGIATITRRFADKARESGVAILDTRKTTPGLRALEKYAVSVGGGTNHRFGLYDAILIKDNHINIAGGVGQAIEAARNNAPGKPIQVEVTNEDQLRIALDLGAEKIMLDNMQPHQVQSALKIVAGKAFIEVSGGINWQSIDKYLIKGVDAISVGALTHSVSSLDISLEIGG